ncbi:MAG: hypothetical protein ACK5LP_03840 [Campylobacteraceae bacterium]
MRKRSLFIVIFIAIALGLVWFYDKQNNTTLNVPLNVSEAGVVTKMEFKVKNAAPYALRVEISNVKDENRKELFSLPLSFTLSLKEKSKNLVFVDEEFIINGISGENKDKSVFREIGNYLFEEGDYEIIFTPKTSETRLQAYKPSLSLKIMDKKE